MKKFYESLGIGTAMIIMIAACLCDGFWKSYYSEPVTIWNGIENTIYLVFYWFGFWIWTREMYKERNGR